MYNPILALPFLAAASALSVPRSTCSFQLTASGSQNGTIGRLIDGQVRLGGGLSQTTFTIGSNGSVTDVAGFGCILTPSIGQFQCDEFASSTGGFAIASNGSFTSGGSSVFYACAASDTEYNIYVTPVANQLKCYEVELSASGCAAASVSSSTCAAVTQQVTVTQTLTQAASQAVETVTVTSVEAESPTTETVTEAQAASTITITYSAPVADSIETVTQVGSSVVETVTITSIEASISEATETVTQCASQNEAIITVTSTEEASTVTKTQTVQVTDDITLSASTVYSTLYETETSTATITQAVTATATDVQTVTVVSSQYVTVTIAEGSTTTAEVVSAAAVQTTEATSSTEAASTMSEATTVASATSSSSTCVATTLTGTAESGNYQYPHLIIPISSVTPTTAAGTQYFGTISSNTSTIFNFDIPSSYSGSTCNLIFLLPDHADLETSSYTETGAGEFDFSLLSTVATSSTTYDNAPSVSSDLGTFTITEGTSTLIKSFTCQAGETVAYEMSSVDDSYLYFFQDWNPSPLGLYITVC